MSLVLIDRQFRVSSLLVSDRVVEQHLSKARRGIPKRGRFCRLGLSSDAGDGIPSQLQLAGTDTAHFEVGDVFVRQIHCREILQEWRIAQALCHWEAFG